MKDTKPIQQDMKVANQARKGRKTAQDDLVIVGIGASAGGLEALLSFLANVPADSGLGFVVIQHMDPHRKDLLVNILKGATAMEVLQVRDHLAVMPNRVYVIPPNKQMSIKDRVLYLSDFPVPHTLRLPIDFFFHSLAKDQQDKSIGVLLSGMGTDGTLGLGAIKEKGGMVFIQEPSSAEFDGMPRSAIEAGLADVIGTVESLPSQIMSYIDQLPGKRYRASKKANKILSAYQKIMLQLRAQTSHDFSAYKRTTVDRRIEHRMSIHQIDKLADYAEFLQQNPQELELLFKELLIGVTSFFREPAEWELLKNKVIPDLLSQRASEKTIRVWVSGCATGEEAYSLAIIFKEVFEQAKPSPRFFVQIFATDLDRDAIDQAREGVFPASIAENISPERLERFFVRVQRGYQVVKNIRDMIIFAQQNMIKDPPFTKIDMLTCRNLLIYLTPEMQKKLIPLFHYSLNPGGYLFLGSAETVGNFTSHFKQLERKSRIYQRLSTTFREEPVEFPSSFAVPDKLPNQPANPVANPVANVQWVTDKIILQKYAPATVLVNHVGDIIYITGRTGKYLEPPAGKANWNLFAMAREGLGYTLSNGFYQALQRNEETTAKNSVVLNEAGSQLVDITFYPITEPPMLRGTVLVIFKDAVAPIILEADEMAQPNRSARARSNREAELEQELIQARSMWEATSTEMQVSQEELKSSNEELQSTNEELQSTNEELTTTKEEIQSLNEELNIVNEQLLVKIDELEQANNVMKNLMDSTKIATLFLDRSLAVNTFTKQMSAITKLIAGDVGRPVTDISSKLFYPELAEDVEQVLRTLGTVEKLVKSDQGVWFNARIQPYRTLDDKIVGVVITFVDVSEYKLLEAELRQTKALLEQQVINQDKELKSVNQRLGHEISKGPQEAAASRDPSGDD